MLHVFKCALLNVFHTHHDKLCSKAYVVLPGDTQHVGQVEREVYDAPAGSCQVGPREQSADKETLHDGNNAEGSQEKKHHARVTVWQQVSHLEKGGRGGGGENKCNSFPVTMLYHFLDDDVTFKSNVMTSARNSLIFYKLLTAG